MRPPSEPSGRARRSLARLRRWLVVRVLDLFFHALSFVARLHPLARPERHGVSVRRDVPYRAGGSRFHALDVYSPPDPSRRRAAAAPAGAFLPPRPTRPPHPVVLYLHGGGFGLLSKDTHWLMGLAFARRGYIVMNANYRLAPRHPFPAALEDACTALLWAHDHAADFDGDPDRIVLAGESAGANLALALAVCCAYRRPEPFARELFDRGIRPAAAVPACGILQVSGVERLWRTRRLCGFERDALSAVADAYLGGAPPPDEAPHDLADPLCVIERGPPDRPLPPAFAFAGTRDPLLADTRRLRAALARAGTPCLVRFYRGELHAFHALVWRAAARRCWRDTFDFLDRHVGEASPATAGLV